MATLNIPDDIMLPLPETDKDAVLYAVLKDYTMKLRQLFSEIESKLP